MQILCDCGDLPMRLGEYWHTRCRSCENAYLKLSLSMRRRIQLGRAKLGSSRITETREPPIDLASIPEQKPLKMKACARCGELIVYLHANKRFCFECRRTQKHEWYRRKHPICPIPTEADRTARRIRRRIYMRLYTRWSRYYWSKPLREGMPWRTYYEQHKNGILEE